MPQTYFSCTMTGTETVFLLISWSTDRTMWDRQQWQCHQSWLLLHMLTMWLHCQGEKGHQDQLCTIDLHPHDNQMLQSDCLNTKENSHQYGFHVWKTDLLVMSCYDCFSKGVKQNKDNFTISHWSTNQMEAKDPVKQLRVQNKQRNVTVDAWVEKLCKHHSQALDK